MLSRKQEEKVTLVGLDFGSTTSSMLAVEANLANNCATVRMEFGSAKAVHRPESIFTPFRGQKIDLDAVRAQVSAWLNQSKIDTNEIFAGGAIVTGLAAERDNAESLTSLIIDLLGEAVVATADDPRLESWLAFMGGSAALSRTYPERAFLNLDIGGGTTNPALGINGNVRETGCHFVGARHFEFVPGGYELRNVSRFGAAIADHLGLKVAVGSTLSDSEVTSITGYFVRALCAIADGDRAFFDNPVGRLIEQAPFESPHAASAALTFSGGVGELVYAIAAGSAVPSTTFYGDLGVDLALAILADPRLSRDVRDYVPEHRGRATVQGLTLNNTEISGTTLFLSGSETLPLRDLPVVATLAADADVPALCDALRLAGRSRRGACLQLIWPTSHPSFEAVKRLGAAMSSALDEADLPDDASIVILTTANVGKALGNYATAWRTTGRKLMIIDEIPERKAHFVNLGRMRNGVVPVSFYGMN